MAGDGRKQRVVRLTVVPGIEAKHPEISSEPPKVPIGNEPVMSQQDRNAVRKYLDLVAVSQLLRWRCRLIVDGQMTYFDVRYAERFNDVCDRVGYARSMLKELGVARWTQKIVKTAVNAEEYVRQMWLSCGVLRV